MIAGFYPGPMAPQPVAAGLTSPPSPPPLAMPVQVDADCPSVRTGVRTSIANAGTVARGRPPSPFIGAGTIVAMQWVVFGACVLQWALS